MISLYLVGMPMVFTLFGCAITSLVLLLAIQVYYPEKIREDVFTEKYFSEFELPEFSDLTKTMDRLLKVGALLR
ncbi:MAG: hypothetical protein R3B54_01505 [Bdellovibrionota bacterium]